MKLKEGQKAPDFKLPNQSGKEHKLSDYKGKWVLVYFYPKDDTPGCTVEACSVRDNMSDLKKKGIVPIGISTDDVTSHKKFADKFKLTFDLLADGEKEVVKLYGVWGKKNFMGKEYMGTNRNSFLINPDGNIAKIYEKVKPAEHVGEVLTYLSQMSGRGC